MTKKRMYVCSIEAAMDVIGGKWKPHILWKIKDAPLRFGAIQEKLPAISQKMLTRQLRALEADRLVSRTEYPGMPPRVEYALTARGQTRSTKAGNRAVPCNGTGRCAGRAYRHFCPLFSCSGENLQKGGIRIGTGLRALAASSGLAPWSTTLQESIWFFRGCTRLANVLIYENEAKQL